jgi:hypothetical protein
MGLSLVVVVVLVVVVGAVMIIAIISIGRRGVWSQRL